MLFAAKYADVLTYNSKGIYDQLQQKPARTLKSFNLIENSSKTEKYQVPKPHP